MWALKRSCALIRTFTIAKKKLLRVAFWYFQLTDYILKPFQYNVNIACSNCPWFYSILKTKVLGYILIR